MALWVKTLAAKSSEPSSILRDPHDGRRYPPPPRKVSLWLRHAGQSSMLTRIYRHTCNK